MLAHLYQAPMPPCDILLVPDVINEELSEIDPDL